MPEPDKILSMNLFYSILDHIIDMSIGVDRIVGIYSTEEGHNKLSGVSLKYLNNRLQEHELILTDANLELRQLQNERLPYKWLNKSQVPFETQNEDLTQLSIFNEHDHLILMIPIPNKTSNRKNLIFIYFKDDVDQFGVQHQKSPLSTQNKSIIGHLISSSTVSYAKMYWQQEDKLTRLAKKSNQIIRNQKSNNKDISRKVELEELVISWSNELLKDCSKADHVNYVYSHEAIDKIKNFSGSYFQLKKSILEAIDYAKLAFTNVNISIEAEFIVFDTDVNNEILQDSEEISPRLLKSFEFLEKLELNALKVAQAGLNLTSYNVGKSMERPITPAAISDYISKNRDKINSLFQQKPDKWSFIRNNFRPIVNVISQKTVGLKDWG